MRKVLILTSGAIVFGLAGGYAWSAMTARAPRPHTSIKAGFAPLPASPEERPAELDQEWTSRSDDKPAVCNDGVDTNGIACAPDPGH
jgi:hypothetical protein